MKKLFFILLCLSVALTADAGPFMKNQSRGLPASGGAPLSLTFFWRMESGTLDGTHDYSAGDAVSDDFGVAYNTDAAKSGTNGADYDGAYHRSDFVDGDTSAVCGETAGTVAGWFRVIDYQDDGYLFNIYEDGSNLIYCRLDGTDEIRCALNNTSGSNSITTPTADLSTNTWYFLEYSYDTVGDSHTLKISATTRGDMADVTEDETLYALDLSGAGALFRFGNHQSPTSDIHQDLWMIFNEADVNAFQYRNYTSYTDF
jgi:hypothetical protein